MQGKESGWNVMYLENVLKAINIKGAAAVNSKVKIIAVPKGETLFSGIVKSVPQTIAKRGWIVIEVLRDREYRSQYPETPDYNLPYIITVM